MHNSNVGLNVKNISELTCDTSFYLTDLILLLSSVYCNLVPNLKQMRTPMNKNDLITSVAQHSGLSKQDATKAIDAVLSSIEDTLKSGGDVGIVGFGTFSVTNRAARTGRNPRTGEPIQIAASKQPKFKAGSPLKDAVNNR
jgi:DNA-binding protein HU-beta